MTSLLLTLLVMLLTLTALIPLFSVVYMLIARGASTLAWENFVSLPPTIGEEGGGFGNALIGTVAMVGIAGLISVPIGVLSAIFLSELGPESRVSHVVEFCAKTLSGFPSILAGVFAYSAIVISFGNSAWAGGVALSILMLPTVLLTATESIRMVPKKMREASIGMGATQTQTTLHVLLPTALPGILTGVMLSVARAAGETAPLLFTALFSNYWMMNNWNVELNQPTASLAVLIYNFSGSFADNQKQMAWSASLILVLLVLSANLIGKSFSRGKPRH